MDSLTPEGFFSEDGLLARDMPFFEFRPEQLRMARIVEEAFSEDKIAVIEAGTGTGKSLAYLVPGIKWALLSGESLVVSTRTINLQEQLYCKDIPFLRSFFPEQFSACLVKGWSNYLCLRRFYSLMRSEQRALNQGEYEELSALMSRMKNGEFVADRSALPVESSDSLWSLICAEADLCLRDRCPFFSRCHLHEERRKMAQSQVLVVNHSLLMADLALRRDSESAQGVLPSYSYLVMDEAHHLEDVATEFLGKSFSSGEFFVFLNGLYRRESGEGEGGFLAVLRNRISGAKMEEPVQNRLRNCLDQDLIPGLFGLRERGSSFEEMVFRWLTRRGHLGLEEKKVRLTEEVTADQEWAPLKEEGLRLAESLMRYASLLGDIYHELSLLESSLWEEMDETLAETRSLKKRFERHKDSLRFILEQAGDSHVYWLESGGGSRSAAITFRSAPLRVAEEISSALLQKLKGGVFTSATLAVGESLKFFNEQIGVSLLPEGRALEAVLPSSFNFKEQVLLGIPTDIPDPSSEEYLSESLNGLVQLITLMEGRTFILFTSVRMLRRFAKGLRTPLEDAGMAFLVQGDLPRHALLQEFKRREQAVLLGMDSFWEGVDVPGRDLECVILARLPFRVPTDPIVEARSEEMERQGLSSFTHYALPMAVLKFKQGFGRLIRSRSDRGVILVLDNRLVSKRYGRQFLKSIPDCTAVKDRFSAILTRVASWL
ncbi:MAG: helicase C-terminal domain-containing protein [bacterium]